MTLRYSHLSPSHQLDAVRRLVPREPTGTTTGTSDGPPIDHVDAADPTPRKLGEL